MSSQKKNRLGAPPQSMALRISCPFCSQRLPRAETVVDLFSAEGRQGGRCKCGAVFVIDEVGHFGGQALLDAQTLACHGDIERALKIDAEKGFEVKTCSLGEAARERRRRNLGLGVQGSFEAKAREPKAGEAKAREPKTREPKTRKPKTRKRGQSAPQGRRRSPRHVYLEPKVWAVKFKGSSDT